MGKEAMRVEGLIAGLTTELGGGLIRRAVLRISHHSGGEGRAARLRSPSERRQRSAAARVEI